LRKTRYNWPPVTPLELEGNDPFSRRVGELAMNLNGLDVFIERVFAIFACATLLFIVVAAAFGAKDGDTSTPKVVAMLLGCLGGVAVALTVGVLVPFAAADTGLVADLVLCPILGCAISYGVARVASR